MRRGRRRFLRGFGATTLALPSFASLAPRAARAEAPANRLVVLYFPNGTRGNDLGTDLYPVGSGADYTLAAPWVALERHRANVTILKNVRNRPADVGEDPNHPRACSCWLTSKPITKSYTDIRAGISMDQVVARALEETTPIPSLVLANGGPVSAPNEGYSPIYYQNVSWLSESIPAPRLEDPGLLFDHLFGAHLSGGPNPAVNAARRAARKSVLDFARAEAQRLSLDLGKADRGRLDQYLSGIRDVERSLERKRVLDPSCRVPSRPTPLSPAASTTGWAFLEQLRVTMQLIVLALQCDLTRVVTYMLDVARSNRSAEFAGVVGAHHDISHHGNNPKLVAKLLKINAFYAERLAEFLDALAAAPMTEGSLLDQCMVLFGSGLGDSDSHRKDHLPLVLAGRGGGRLHPGTALELPLNTPLANVHLTLMKHMGVSLAAFGDSTGTLAL